MPEIHHYLYVCQPLHSYAVSFTYQSSDLTGVIVVVGVLHSVRSELPHQGVNYYRILQVCTCINKQWNLSITAIQIKDTSVIRTAIDGPKRLAIETCTYPTSELRAPLYSVLQTQSHAPKRSYCIVNELYNTVKAMPPRMIASASESVPHGSS